MSDRCQIRVYRPEECVCFRKTKEKFGGLSNMAGGYPLRVNGVLIPSAEALYQACRFPHKPDIQEKIIKQHSPMTAKMVSKPHRKETRYDWNEIRVRVMRWCLRAKLIMHWPEFGGLLLSTGDKQIVEDSRKDAFWGAKKQDDGTLVGMNVLGRLLMELREELKGPNSEALQILEPPPIQNFLIIGDPIEKISFADEKGAKLVDPDVNKEKAMLWSIPKAKEPITDVGIGTEETKDVPVSVADTETANEYKGSKVRYPKRLIEVDLPIKRISAHARREKCIRHGHISTLHIWWARRPLAACRAVTCAALWPDPADEICPQAFIDKARELMLRWSKDHLVETICSESQNRFVAYQNDPDKLNDNIELRMALLDFIADFSAWESSTNQAYLKTARALTQSAHEALGGVPGTRPLVVDPFAGGGSIPLEALRVGADAFASDLNPVAVLLNKVVLEYIPKYGKSLADEVRKWGQWVKEQAEKELSQFYPNDEDGATPMAYLWARTITCEGPGCGTTVPLIRSLWLAKKKNKSVAVQMIPKSEEKRVDFEIIEKHDNGKWYKQGTRKTVNRPKLDGTVARGSVTCPCCGYTTPVTSVREQLKKRHGGAADAQMWAVVTTRHNVQGRFYRLPIQTDLDVVRAAEEELNNRIKNHKGELSLIPDESTVDYCSFVNRGGIYGLSSWRDYYNSRQLLTHSSLSKFVKDLTSEFQNTEKGEAIKTLLALAVSRHVDINSSFSAWHNTRELVNHVFAKQAISMVWDFCEANTFSSASGNFLGGIRWIVSVIEKTSDSGLTVGHACQCSATSHSLPNDSAVGMITDPPYYYSVQYADLADYFYVWLRRILKDTHPTLFSPSVIEKSDEVIVQSPAHINAPNGKNRSHYESKMMQAMAEGRRVVSPDGFGIVVFAHTSTAGWETQLQAMVDAGWIITASWPIDTEMATRVISQGRSVLASSIHLACRPRENEDGSVRMDDIGDWREVLGELPSRIKDWMARLSEEGVVGADAIFACLGPALEIFSRYSKVEKANGEEVTLREYLEQVWAAVSNEALEQVFKGANTSGFEEDSRLTAMWLWTLGAGANGNGKEESKTVAGTGYILEFDAARKIAQGLGAHLEQLDKLIEVKGNKARLLPVSERAEYLFGKDKDFDMPRGRKKKKQPTLFDLEDVVEEDGSIKINGHKVDKLSAGQTTLDRVHQAMLLFAAGRSEAVRRFLVDEGIGADSRFWTLAQALSALYPSNTEEKRWVDGVLARKKGLGF